MNNSQESECLNCNSVIPDNSTSCPACGWSWQEQPKTENSSNTESTTTEQRVINALEQSFSSKPINGIVGSALIVFGTIVWLIAYSHRPFENMADAFERYGTSVMDPGRYQFIVITAIIMIVAGLYYLIKWIIYEREYSPGHTSTGNGLDEIKKAKELLDSGAINADEYENIKKTALKR